MNTTISRFEQAAVDARAMAEWEWTPPYAGIVAPNDPFAYPAGVKQTGLPYSSTKHVGKAIGEEIFFKTFMAALQNPQSVLYTEDLSTYGDLNPSNATTYYGIVCSKLTSYGLRHGTAVLSRFMGPSDPGDPNNRKDIHELHARDATNYDKDVTPPKVGDIVWYTGHTRMVVEVNRINSGLVSGVTLAESIRNTAELTVYSTGASFQSMLNLTSPDNGLLRIANLDTYRGDNVAWTFPDYSREVPTINADLLLDRGDWVPYTTEQPVKFNVLRFTSSRTGSDVAELVVRRGNTNVYNVTPISGTGVITKALTEPGQYTAHLVYRDGSVSQFCEFAVVDTNLSVASSIDASSDFNVSWSVTNATPRFVFVRCLDEIDKRYFYFLTDADRAAGQITIPGGDVNYTGAAWIVLVSENELGRVSSINNSVTFT